MSYVWCVFEQVPYEGEYFKGAFASLKLANLFMKHLCISNIVVRRIKIVDKMKVVKE